MGSSLAAPQPKGEDYVYVHEPSLKRVLGRLSGSSGDELRYVLETHVLDPDGTLRETSSVTGRASTWAGARGGSWLFVARDDELVTLALDPNTGRTRQVSALSYRGDPLTYSRLASDPNGRLLAPLTVAHVPAPQGVSR